MKYKKMYLNTIAYTAIYIKKKQMNTFKKKVHRNIYVNTTYYILKKTLVYTCLH